MRTISATYDFTLLKPSDANSFGNFLEILGFTLIRVVLISSSFSFYY